MDQGHRFHPASPLLDHCPPGLPAAHYFDPVRHNAEIAAIWRKTWICVGRTNDLAHATMRRILVAGQNIILVKDGEGRLTAFHNTCRHRGSELLCVDEKPLASRLISCPYHQWSYDLSGQLVRIPFVETTGDFSKAGHGLYKVAVRQWNGFDFVCLADNPPDFALAPDMGVGALDKWPMADLVTGHRFETTLDCNWKIFWENYNECLHCPGIHPGLADMVPVYAKGYMTPEEDPHWTPDAPVDGATLKKGARTWSVNGMTCGPDFKDLGDEQKAAGHFFVTMLPSLFIVAHVDYVRAVRVMPLGPEKTHLSVEWLFLPETMAQPDFDLANITDFATRVLLEDGQACEMNQRGVKSAAFEQGRLMPQEFDVHRFHNWVRAMMGEL